MLIRVKNALAALAVAAVLAPALPAVAADLDDGPPPHAAYDDPRYGAIYGVPPPPPRYAAPYGAPRPYRDGYRDERYAPPPYAGPPPAYRQGYAVDCLPQHVIRDRLASRGWHDFHDPQIAGNVAHVRARRQSGRMFDLTVDRCSGEVLAMEPIDRRRADLPPPPDWRYRERGYGY